MEVHSENFRLFKTCWSLVKNYFSRILAIRQERDPLWIINTDVGITDFISQNYREGTHREVRRSMNGVLISLMNIHVVKKVSLIVSTVRQKLVPQQHDKEK